MGLDITFGLLVFLAAVRGWFKGFLRQAIPLAALVGCVYLADPVRDLARPHASRYFPSIGPDVMDRLLWWTAAVLSYVVTAGIALSILKSMRKRTYGEPEPNRTDQGAGFTLGALKGVIVASFLASGVAKVAPTYLNKTPMVEDQTRASKAMAWAEQYRPAERLWSSPPVQALVARVKSRGMWSAPEPKKAGDAPAPEADPTVTAKTAKPASPSGPVPLSQPRPRTLSLPGLDPASPEFNRELEDEMRRQGLNPDWR